MDRAGSDLDLEQLAQSGFDILYMALAPNQIGLFDRLPIGMRGIPDRKQGASRFTRRECPVQVGQTHAVQRGVLRKALVDASSQGRERLSSCR
ncbi:hypothetical protein D3C76_1533860 [compost metagenome]